MKVLTQVDLQPRNTLAVPARAEFFVECSSVNEIKEALYWAQSKSLAYRVLAGGSNVVLAEYLPGLTLVPKLKGKAIVHETQATVQLQIGAGENWHALVQHCVEQGWYGLENLALIPGSVGAAPIQNIGAYDVEIKNFIYAVVALNTKTLEEKRFSKEECLFGYRESLFKKNQHAGHYIITSVILQLSTCEQTVVVYPALNAYLLKHGQAHTAKNVMHAVVDIRQRKLPNPASLPNAGSFFKNPTVSKSQYEALKQAHSKLVAFPQAPNEFKIAAAWLIEQCGWKGREENGVGVHTDHALVIVNSNRKPAKAVLALAQSIRKEVKAKFGINLVQEPRILV